MWNECYAAQASKFISVIVGCKKNVWPHSYAFYQRQHFIYPHVDTVAWFCQCSTKLALLRAAFYLLNLTGVAKSINFLHLLSLSKFYVAEKNFSFTQLEMTLKREASS